ELNRTSPKSQAALLEAMAEGSVTIDGKTYELPEPFFLVATQNPHDFHGVYPLSESQLDRFAMLVRVSLPTPDQEMDIYRESGIRAGATDPGGGSVISSDTLRSIRSEIHKVFIEETVLAYATEIIRSTRTLEGV